MAGNVTNMADWVHPAYVLKYEYKPVQIKPTNTLLYFTNEMLIW